MKAEIKERWLEALESGRYKQARGTIRSWGIGSGVESIRYCCLGVLCDLYLREVTTTQLEYDVEWDRVIERGSGHLPGDVMKWAGLKETNPSLPSRGSTCSGLNDGWKHPPMHHNSGAAMAGTKVAKSSRWEFKDIAEAIRKDL